MSKLGLYLIGKGLYFCLNREGWLINEKGEDLFKRID